LTHVFANNGFLKNTKYAHITTLSIIYLQRFIADAYFVFIVLILAKLSIQNAHAVKRFFLWGKGNSFYLISKFF